MHLVKLTQSSLGNRRNNKGEMQMETRDNSASLAEEAKSGNPGGKRVLSASLR